MQAMLTCYSYLGTLCNQTDTVSTLASGLYLHDKKNFTTIAVLVAKCVLHNENRYFRVFNCLIEGLFTRFPYYDMGFSFKSLQT